MAKTIGQPLVLVADDAPEYIEDIPPRLEKELNAQVLVAPTVLDACAKAAEHHSRSEDPLELIVLDMHMPLHEDTKKIAVDGGIQFLRSYRLVTCPVVVFTAYWSYHGCGRAIQAGATAYVPKQSLSTGDGNKEGGINDLVKTCRQLLEQSEPTEQSLLPPSDKWLQEHYGWLCQEYPNYWVAFIEARAAHTAAISGTERAGLVVVASQSEDSLQRTIMSSVAKLGCVPPIVLVPEKGHEIQE